MGKAKLKVPYSRTSGKGYSPKFAPGFRSWHHACGGKGLPAWEVGLEGEDLVSLIRRYPLIAFFVLAYALAWWIWILYAFDIIFLGPIFALGPFLAAIIVTAVTRGTAGLKALLSRMVRWRVGLGWYAAALLLPVAVYLFAVSLNILLGARASTAEQFGSWYLNLPALCLQPPLPIEWRIRGGAGLARLCPTAGTSPRFGALCRPDYRGDPDRLAPSAIHNRPQHPTGAVDSGVHGFGYPGHLGVQ